MVFSKITRIEDNHKWNLFSVKDFQERVVENAFGIMTSRFRVFSSEIELKPKKVDNIVLAYCALYKVLLKENKSLNIRQNKCRVEIANLEILKTRVH